MPLDIMGFCALRSTFARLGFVSPLTVVDAGFEGTLTIGVFYGGSIPIKVPVGCRFLHVVFGQLKTEVNLPYQGYYKMQKGVSIPKSLI
jgi:dCTP deaminase